MKNLVLTFAVLAVILVSGCITQNPLVCNKPYILVGNSCCLDSNGNSVCDKDEVTTTTAQVTTTTTLQLPKTQFSDQEILDVVYSDYKVPEGFYKDVLEKGEKISDIVYYERILINNKWVFYCTNNFYEAKQLVEKSINEYNQGGHPRILLETTENEKFFEFKTIENQTKLPDNKYYFRYRVFKCNYISDLQNISFYAKKDLAIPENYIGKFSERPIAKDNVKELVEFLWYSVFSNYNLGGIKGIEFIF